MLRAPPVDGSNGVASSAVAPANLFEAGVIPDTHEFDPPPPPDCDNHSPRPSLCELLLAS